MCQRRLLVQDVRGPGEQGFRVLMNPRTDIAKDGSLGFLGPAAPERFHLQLRKVSPAPLVGRHVGLVTRENRDSYSFVEQE